MQDDLPEINIAPSKKKRPTVKAPKIQVDTRLVEAEPSLDDVKEAGDMLAALDVPTDDRMLSPETVTPKLMPVNVNDLEAKVIALEQELKNLRLFCIRFASYSGFANYLKEYGYKPYQPTKKEMHKYS